MPTTREAALTNALSGSRLDVLSAMRAHIAKSIDDGASTRDLASLTKRLSDIDAEVRALQAENDPISEAAAMAPQAWES